eukprot:TRINITY_DN13672_c0_g1_i1.p1 TRINITY_DN13672_c0_g1~~TRINITY_DN13672_c0_g1_i1.p1  ORF type:complete len:654 (+),score=250.66 TRINITY_DN13672_c0_g1_i1:142-1962(+)
MAPWRVASLLCSGSGNGNGRGAISVFALLLVVAAAAVGGARGTIVHVEATGQDAGGCGSEASPCLTLAYAAAQHAEVERLQLVLGDGSFSGDVTFPSPTQDVIIQSLSADPHKSTVECSGSKQAGGCLVSHGPLSLQLVTVTAQEVARDVVAAGATSTVVLSGCVVERCTPAAALAALPALVASDGPSVVLSACEFSANAIPLTRLSNGSLLVTTSSIHHNVYSVPPPSFARAPTLFEATLFQLAGSLSSSFSGVNISSNTGWDRVIGMAAASPDLQPVPVLHFNSVAFYSNEASLAVVQAAGVSFLADFCVFSGNMAAALVTTVPLAVDTLSTQTTITGSRFERNAPLLLRSSRVGLTSCTFSHYSVGSVVGSVATVYNPAHAAVLGCTFASSSGPDGSSEGLALLVFDCTHLRETDDLEYRVDMLNNTFSDNTHVGSVALLGPVKQGELHALVNSTRFERNTATHGAAVQVLSGNTDLTLSFDVFEDNTAEQGGAVYCTAENTPSAFITRIAFSGELEFDGNEADDGDDWYTDEKHPCAVSCSKANAELCDLDSSNSWSEDTVLLILGLVMGGIIVMAIALIAAWGLYRAKELKRSRYLDVDNL